MANWVSLPKLVESLEITNEELSFQIRRLDDMVEPRTESEAEYFANLKQGYREARRWVGILSRYHRGRLERAMRGEELPDLEGVGGPYIDEGD